MPELDWIGKQYLVNHTDDVPFRLLDHVFRMLPWVKSRGT